MWGTKIKIAQQQIGIDSEETNLNWNAINSLHLMSWDPDWQKKIIFYKYKTSTHTPFQNHYVIQLPVWNIQKLTKNPYGQSNFTVNPVSTKRYYN